MIPTVAISHPERVMYPATGFTKADVLAYYRAVAPVMVPHLAGRPMMLGRWPEGVDGRGFGQFECRGRPEWMSSAPLRLRDGRVVDVCIVNDEPSLVWLANQGVLELHPYLARWSSFDTPLAIVFDLDPGPPASLVECCRVALRLRDVLGEHNLRAVAKTSGGSGLHVFVPLNVPVTYADTKPFARSVAARLAADLPDLVVDRMSKAVRPGRVFIDWGQNDERKQTVAAYSLRAADSPIVSTPLSWGEVAAGVDGAALVFSPADVIDRISRLGDHFAPMLTLTQQLPARSSPR